MQEDLIILGVLVLMGCGWTSYKIGIKGGVSQAIDYFVNEGLIEIDEE
jgi:hypothetical protein